VVLEAVRAVNHLNQMEVVEAYQAMEVVEEDQAMEVVEDRGIDVLIGLELVVGLEPLAVRLGIETITVSRKWGLI
jgi:hypothetical protein